MGKATQFEVILRDKDPVGSEKLNNFIKEHIEYSFWEWLNNAPQSYHTIEYESINGISGIVGGANYDSMEKIEITPHDESNLIKIAPPRTTLPQESKVVFKDSIYIIETPCSNISIQFSRRGNGLTGVYDNLSKRIFEMNQIDYHSDNLSFHTYVIKIHYEVKPFKRFSQKAKREKDWLIRLENQLKDDFSWEVIRDKFKEMK